jgi:hypothetical protein
MADNPDSKMGVLNPYATAEIILKQKYCWGSMSSDAKKGILKLAFNRSYEKLFDPAFNSPLYPKKKPDKQGTKTPSPLLTGGDTCTSCSGTWSLNANYSFFNPSSATKSVTNPVQGSFLANCYFIAALASVTWVTPALITKKLNRAVPGEDTFSFYVSPGTAVDPISLNEKLPYITSSGGTTLLPCYSRSNRTNESWPALYEKAYAAWIGKQKGLTNYNEPDYTVICKGDPFCALEQLTGKSSANTVWTTTAFANGKEIYDKILEKNVDATGLKTKYPAVAVTYPSYTSAPVPAISGDDTHYTIQYNSAQIVANHSYSLLGIHRNNGKNYIILRNPYGISDPDASVAPFLTNLGNTSSYPDMFTSGSWGPLTTLGKKLQDPDGIFALNAEVFRTHFYKFGWIV